MSPSFRIKYKQKFGNEAQLTFAGSAYEMALLLGQVYNDKKVTNADDLIKAFAEVRDRAGVLGTYSFVDDKTFGKFFDFPVVVKRVVGSNGVPVG